MNEAQLLYLYRMWSEQNWCAGFVTPAPEVVRRFRHELPALMQLESYVHNLPSAANPPSKVHLDYEQAFLLEFHHQEETAKARNVEPQKR